jgi:50S ribosomal protein L16 3-hydroxylase
VLSRHNRPAFRIPAVNRRTFMSLQSLLAECPKRQFVSEHLYRLPYSRAGTAREFCSLGSWDTLGPILGQSPDLLIVRGGERFAGADPKSLEEARHLSADGYTIVVRHAERNDARLRALAIEFERDFHAPVDVHMYFTPPGAHGFSWHYDAEDVFIIQTAGAKQYSLRKNTVNPWPLVETIPRNMHYERELMPLMRVDLHAADWLYIPCGYWHKADALPGNETAVSLAVGVMSRSAIELLDFLRECLIESILWRQRLPVNGEASALSKEEIDEQTSLVIQQLAADFKDALSDEHLPSRFREWCRTNSPSQIGDAD